MASINYTANPSNNNPESITSNVYGLQMNANEYQGFRVYLNDTPVDTFYIYESARYFVKTIDLANYRIDEGWHVFKVKAITRGGEFPIGNDSGIQFYCSGTSSRVKPFSYINIDSFDVISNDHVEVTYTVNGYGTVELSSITRDNVDRMKGRLYGRNVLKTHVIEKNDYDLQTKGFTSYRLTASINLDLTELGEFPLGTIWVRAFNENCDKSVEFYSMNEVDFSVYDDRYKTQLIPSYNATGLYGFDVAVVDLSTVYKDWMTLVNLVCYVRSAVKGEIDLSYFSRYIPGKGEVIQAWMYNALLDSVAECASDVGVWTNVRPHVSSGDVIPSDFIQTLGSIVNACISKKLEENRAKLGRH